MSEALSPVEVTQRRTRSGWRERVAAATGELSPVIATGLLIHFQKSAAIREAAAALRALDPAARQAIWSAAFPCIAREVELVWEQFPMEVIARRDAGGDGLGSPFRWPVSESEADALRIEWVRKLLIVAGPFPEFGLVDLVRHLALVAGGRIEETAGDYRTESTGLSYDDDAVGYAAACTLTRDPDGEVSRQVVAVMDGQLTGRLPHGTTRAICTAWLCADRPDLWAKIDGYLAESGAEPGFLRALIGSRKGILPGAWLHFVRTIRDGKLLRFAEVAERVKSAFRIPWLWKSGDRDELEAWFARWVEMQESAEARESAWSADDPADHALALWGEALHDGERALQRIARPGLTVNQRLAAAHFLRACPGSRVGECLVDLATDPDLRVANTAAAMLSGPDAPRPSAMGDRFGRFGTWLESLPESPELPPMPAPFPEAKLELGPITQAFIRSVPDGEEAQLERLLPRLDAGGRTAVIHHLNRFRLNVQAKEIARHLRGEGAGEWQRLLEESGGAFLFDQRRILLKLLHDRSAEIAEHAFKAVKAFVLTREEAAELRPLLASRNAKKLDHAAHLVANQPPAVAAPLLAELLGGKKAGERLAALEILRRWSLAETTIDPARKVLAAADFKPSSADEERALGVLSAALGPVKKEEAATLGNAFGLVAKGDVEEPRAARERPVRLHSPVTIALIQAIDGWLQARSDVMIPSTQPWLTQEPQRLGDVSLPTVNLGKSIEENLEQFPPARELVAWWDERGPELRDDDGFELIRLHAAGSAISDQRTSRPDLTRPLLGIESEVVTRSKKHEITRLADWLAYLRPDELSREGWREFMVDAAETAVARLGDKLGWAQAWTEPVNRRILRGEGAPALLLRQYWELGRGRGHWDRWALHFWIHDVARFHRLGIATDAEVIWRLVGERPFKTDYERADAFADLAAASTPLPHPQPDLTHPGFAAVVTRVCERVVELELQRGETPEAWSWAALAIRRIEGSRHLARLLAALGSLPLTRKKSLRGNLDLTRPAVLVHLIGVCRPAAGDTAGEFSRQMREAGVAADRLFEVAVLRPVWAEFVGHATGVDGLRDAVGWIFAHTRTADYGWEANARELWAGELAAESPVSADEFISGAVDAEWFERARRAVGDAVWDKLHAAAKFASTGSGHTRARLFSDALAGKATVASLRALLEEKGNLDAALALGLPALPDDPAKRSGDLLERYGILAALKERSRKSKAQRRASELAAFDTGVRNLARRAGFDDTTRFEWTMECQASADLAAGALSARAGDVALAIGILPDGSLELSAARDGTPLKTVPAAVKKDAAFKALRDRMGELKLQAQRIRPALEDLMVHGIAMKGSDWQPLLRHPLAGPLLRRLVLVAADGTLGMPAEDGWEAADGHTTGFPDGLVRIAHPEDFLPAECWHAWQRRIFDREIVQPFKQVFREFYPRMAGEADDRVTRFGRQPLRSHQLAAILTQRGWSFHPDSGLSRHFRADGVVAWLDFEEFFHHFGEQEHLTLAGIRFTGPKPFAALPAAAVPGRVFSEALRDVDLIVSVAHASGADPESTASTIESRAALVRETSRLLGFGNVFIDGRQVRIAGKLGNYRVHLGSGTVHRDPGGMIPVASVPRPEFGRIFLPFADEDERSAEILGRILWFAEDDRIRDPALARHLRQGGSAI